MYKFIIISILIILLILIIIPCYCIDHFTNVNGLNIKYNKYTVPGDLEEKKENKKNELRELLENQPLAFENQIYSSPKYPYIGPKTKCDKNSDCEISAYCADNKICNLIDTSETLFSIPY